MNWAWKKFYNLEASIDVAHYKLNYFELKFALSGKGDIKTK